MQRESFRLEGGEGHIDGWVVFPQSEGGCPLVVLCHGIPSSAPVEGDTGYEGFSSYLAMRGLAALFFNFRGTGFSAGNFSLRGWVEDLGLVLGTVFRGEGIFSTLDLDRVVVWGFSGGAAAAIDSLSKDHRPRALIAMSSFDTIERLVSRENACLFVQHCRTVGIIRDEGYPANDDQFFEEMLAYDPIRHISDVSPVPLLLVHGSCDETVPVECAYHLFEKAAEPKRLIIVEKGQHKLRLNEEAIESALDWLSGLGIP